MPGELPGGRARPDRAAIGAGAASLARRQFATSIAGGLGQPLCPRTFLAVFGRTRPGAGRQPEGALLKCRAGDVSKSLVCLLKWLGARLQDLSNRPLTGD